MHFEVECKVRIEKNEVKSLHDSISLYVAGGECQDIEKKDTYYSQVGNDITLFRVRSVEGSYLITRKMKEARNDGVEVNQEIEFTANGQFDSIHSFFTSLGYSIIIKKEKRGWAWHEDNLTIELVEVAPLGWFLEIEVLIEQENLKRQALDRLEKVREDLHIYSRELVPMYYNDMLKEIRK